MTEFASDDIRELLEKLYQDESRRILATLIRLLGDFDAAEDALHDAFRSALEQWPVSGVPANPRAWLVSAGRFKAIDAARRRTRLQEKLPELALHADTVKDSRSRSAEEYIADDQLRLIFTCCHPALSPEARVALTLREVCGLSTAEIARAFRTSSSTVAQRIVRAKVKIRTAPLPYRVPEPAELPERLDTVLRVIYLMFSAGRAKPSGDFPAKPDLSGEALRLGRLLVKLLPEPEANGLLSFMLLHEARRSAQSTQSVELFLLEEQDRSLWNMEFLKEGIACAERALPSGGSGQYGLQAAIAAEHARAATAASADWERIVNHYDSLLRIAPSPVQELNRAVAVAMRSGPRAGLSLIDALLRRGEMRDHFLPYAARADLCIRLGETEEAAESYRKALSLTQHEAERHFLEQRLREIS